MMSLVILIVVCIFVFCVDVVEYVRLATCCCVASKMTSTLHPMRDADSG